MLKISHKAVISAAAAVMLTACVDDDYDLSNLDTTVKVNVNELIIPVNIDEVLLSDILKLDQDDHVEIVDGFPRVGQRSSGEVLRRFGEFGFRHVWRGLGWLLNFHTKGFNMFLGMDHTLGSVTKEFIPLSSNGSVNMGINIPS